MTDYYLAGNAAAGKPGVLDALQTFLVTTAGWTLLDSQAGPPRLRVFRSPARISTDYGDIAVQEDAATNRLDIAAWYGASSPNAWVVATPLVGQAGFPALYDNVGAESQIWVNAGATLYWFMADEYRFMIHTFETAGAGPLNANNYYNGYGGFADSAFLAANDPYPMLGKGQGEDPGGAGITSWDTEGAGCRMFDSAGAAELYSAFRPTWNGGAAAMLNVQPDARVAPPSYAGIELILATAGPTGGLQEVRGVPRGVIQLTSALADLDTVVMPNGTTYIVFDDYGYGPVV